MKKMNFTFAKQLLESKGFEVHKLLGEPDYWVQPPCEQPGVYTKQEVIELAQSMVGNLYVECPECGCTYIASHQEFGICGDCDRKLRPLKIGG